MKKILLGTALLLSSSTLFAQSTTMTGSDARIGIKAGVNLSTVRYSGSDYANEVNDHTKSNIGYNFTVYGDFGVGNNFFIQPGITLQNKGTKVEMSETLGGTTTSLTSKIDVMSIDVPVNAVLRIPTGQTGAFQISAGPYIGFNIDGKRKETVSDGTNSLTDKDDLSFGSGQNDDVSSMDFGANFGLGYRLNNGFTIGANYGLGLSNLVPKDNRTGDEKATSRIIGFSIGYSF